MAKLTREQELSKIEAMHDSWRRCRQRIMFVAIVGVLFVPLLSLALSGLLVEPAKLRTTHFALDGRLKVDRQMQRAPLKEMREAELDISKICLVVPE